jgi:hypothetical protein
MTADRKARCVEIAAALDRDDLGPWRRAEASLSPEERGAVWDARHVVAVGQREAAARPAVITDAVRTSRIETRWLDLDYWASDDIEPPDDDDGDMPVCPACDGRGKDAAGNVCAVCHGTGKFPSGDDDENEDDVDELED